MQLFGSFTSPYVRHVRIVLQETGLNCELIETSAQDAAGQSPTMKIPFLRDGDIELTDSTSILCYIREKSGQNFLPLVQDLDLYCLINTLLDSTINLFLFERFGMDITENPYLKRQQARIEGGLKYLEELGLSKQTLDKNTKLRLECFLVWGCYRNRFSLDELSILSSIVDTANATQAFISTAPPVDA